MVTAPRAAEAAREDRRHRRRRRPRPRVPRGDPVRTTTCTRFSHEELDIGDHDAVMATVAAAPARRRAEPRRVHDGRRERDAIPRARSATTRSGPQSLALAATDVRRRPAARLDGLRVRRREGRRRTTRRDDTAPDQRVRPREAARRSDSCARRSREHFIVRTGYVFGGGSDYLTRAGRDGCERASGAAGIERPGRLADVRPAPRRAAAAARAHPPLRHLPPRGPRAGVRGSRS